VKRHTASVAVCRDFPKGHHEKHPAIAMEVYTRYEPDTIREERIFEAFRSQIALRVVPMSV